MAVYAVIDTNVVVSSLITHDDRSPTVSVILNILDKKIVPLYSTYLLNEYREVLTRPKFGFFPENIETIILTIQSYGIQIEPKQSDVVLPDMKDLPIYEIALDTRNIGSFLITGNIRHFPSVSFVVTPKQMVAMISKR